MDPSWPRLDVTILFDFFEKEKFSGIYLVSIEFQLNQISNVTIIKTNFLIIKLS